jgi:predicted AlkP superfamily phosphohydrolase/phosphomutase
MFRRRDNPGIPLPAARVALLVFVLFAGALEARAYVGPGAGFAVLSSFLTLFLAFVYALFALVTWPLRQLWRLVRRRKAYRAARVRRVIIVGFDGLDPDLATRWMGEGKLPHFDKLRQLGTFRTLETTHPPISPVAWSTFLTGVNPGKHNIYDFLARDRHTYMPYLSSALVRGPKRSLRLGRYRLPIGRPQIKALRKGVPFWHYLGKAGVFSSVIRVPITFPPEKFGGVLLSGMCVPDLRGSQGTFSFYSTRPGIEGKHEGGVMFGFERQGEALRGELLGPDSPSPASNGKSELRVPFVLHPEAKKRSAVLVIGKSRIQLVLGEYSEWVEVKFRAGLGIQVAGICRFYLKEVAPEVELYVTPVQIDPRKPALPISHPLSYAVYLGKLQGPFSTLGLAEDTWGLNEGALDDQAFLEQCYQIHDEREKMFFDALEKTSRGVCICVFDITDRVQHMFWRHMEPGHPAAAAGANGNGKGGGEKREVIERMYRRMDALVGRVIEQLKEDEVLLVLSDHGFKSFRRGVNLNSWLHRNGYLALKEGATESAEWFAQVDWERTRAYSMGLNGLYINQAGRERHGLVAEGEEAKALRAELRQKLRGLPDPQTGQAGIREVFDASEVYTGPYGENAPDLLIGYAPGFRASWETVSGRVCGEVFVDNTKAWSGDHCIDARAVPGVLFANRVIACDQASIADVAPTVLQLFGVPTPRHFDGKAWLVAEPVRAEPVQSARKPR